MNRKFGTTELRKALAVSGTGQYLVPEDLEPQIRDYLFYLSPLTERIKSVMADGHIHQVVRQTAVNRGWFEGESTAPAYSQSTYGRRSAEVKILRVNGKVTGFQQAASKKFVDSLAKEIDSAAVAFADLAEFAAIYGMDDDMTEYEITGDAYQARGLYGWMLEDTPDATAATSTIYDANANGAAGATVTLTMLDTAYARTVGKYRAFSRDPYVWLMSQAMIDKVSGLQTRISRDVPRVEFEGGMVMSSYKNIPILPSQFVAPGASASPATITATPVVSGSLDDDTYYYRVAAITMYGEQIASAEANATTAGTQSTVRLSWTAVADAKLYAIYRGLASGDNNLALLDIIAAKTYDATGAVTANVNSYDDDGTNEDTAAVQPLDSGEETIWLVNTSIENGLSRPVLDQGRGDPVSDLLRFYEIPVATDELAFKLQHYGTFQVPWGQSSAVIRRAKAS
jgi:hypothetical protein